MVEKNKNRNGLSASEYFSNADITDLRDEELKELNDEEDDDLIKKYVIAINISFYLSKPLIKYMK